MGRGGGRALSATEESLGRRERGGGIREWRQRGPQLRAHTCAPSLAALAFALPARRLLRQGLTRASVVEGHAHMRFGGGGHLRAELLSDPALPFWRLAAGGTNATAGTAGAAGAVRGLGPPLAPPPILAAALLPKAALLGLAATGPARAGTPGGFDGVARFGIPVSSPLWTLPPAPAGRVVLGPQTLGPGAGTRKKLAHRATQSGRPAGRGLKIAAPASPRSCMRLGSLAGRQHLLALCPWKPPHGPAPRAPSA